MSEHEYAIELVDDPTAATRVAAGWGA